MGMSEIPPVKRGRGRPRKTPIGAPTAGYPGIALDTILRMSDEQVQASFTEIGVTPSPFLWSDTDDQINVSMWHSYGRLDKDEPYLPIDQLKATAREIHNSNLRTELLRACVRLWIETLDDGQLVAEVERLSAAKLSVSEVRYAKRTDLQQRVSELCWPVILAESTLYAWPVNPLTGRSTKDEAADGSRIPRRNDG